MTRRVLSLLLLVSCSTLAGCDGGGDEAALPDAVTFCRDVAPIIFEHCSACHRPGESAPFNLRTYDQVRRRARQIADVTQTRYMPPWLPAPETVEFEGERRLSDREIAILARWADQGMPEGDRVDLPTSPVFTEGWQLGEPDLVVTMDETYTLQAEGFDVFRNFVIPIPVDERKYVSAVELRPGNPQIVHHAVMFTDRTRSSQRLDAQDEALGFPGMDVASAENPDGHFLGWTPGKLPLAPIQDVAWRLDPGTDLLLQLHMVPSGKQEQIRPSIGFFFADAPPTKHLYHVSLKDDFIDIAPGETTYVIRDEYELPVAADVVSIYPHAHYVGKRLRGWAILPDGTKRWLIDIPDWDFNWQDQYRYAEPIPLPAGTTLHMEYVYDNSSANPRNPHVPPRRVTFGLESTDEMGRLGIQVMPKDGMAALSRLREDKIRHDQLGEIDDIRRMARVIGDTPDVHLTLGRVLRRAGRLSEAEPELVEAVRAQPERADAHAELGALRQEQARNAEAAEAFATALRLDPEHVEAHYGLGNALLKLGRTQGAIASYRAALERQPDHVSALYNLGIVLQQLGAIDEAEMRYRDVVRYDPDHANAHYNLGIALGSQGRTAEAAEHFRRAVECRPDFAEAHNNLGVALDATGRREEAIVHFREAVRLRPDYESARRNLDRATSK